MVIVTGYTGEPHVSSQQQADMYKAIIGPNNNYVFDIGSKFLHEIVTSNLIKIHDGLATIQGREVCIDFNDYDEVVIENGTQGYNRYDLICIKYEKNSTTSIESATTIVLKGTPALATPADPTYVNENIREGGYTAYFPLYRVYLNGISLASVTALFTIQKPFSSIYTDTLSMAGEKTFEDGVISDMDIKSRSGDVSLNDIRDSLYPVGGFVTHAVIGNFLYLRLSSVVPVHDCKNRIFKNITVSLRYYNMIEQTVTVIMDNPVEDTEYIRYRNGFVIRVGGRLASNSAFNSNATAGTAIVVFYDLL